MLATLLALTGCNRVSRQDAREQNHEMVAQAYDLIEEGEFRAAGRLLREVVETHPSMARPHLDLAMILHDHRRDYFGAVHHYRRYLSLRPGTEKEAMILERKEQAMASFVTSYVRALPEDMVTSYLQDFGLTGKVHVVSSASDEDATAALRQELEAVESEVAERDQLIAALEQERDTLASRLESRDEDVRELEDEIATLRESLQRLEEEQVSMREAVPDRAVADEVAIAAAEEDALLRTYEVRPNDSLSGIAERVYGDATKWRVIQQANREVLGDSDILRIGQVLVIPEDENRR